MACNELIKNFERIRAYMRDFYIYGFRSREEFQQKSPRSYDDERRRIESWLGDYMGFRQTPEGKNVFISIDSRVIRHDPLYKAWKAKSFTDGDITLHFCIFDILWSPEIKRTAGEITEEIDRKYLSIFREPKVLDQSTVRKKLKEYAELGLLQWEKEGRSVVYYRSEATPPDWGDALDFFSEVAPCGVIGSFLLDKAEEHGEHFAFKHHYINHTLDSQILCALFEAMHHKRQVQISNLGKRSAQPREIALLPLKVFLSVQSGRQYLLAYQPSVRRIRAFRLDQILSVKEAGPGEDMEAWREKLEGMLPHMWGVSAQGSGGRTEHVEFTLSYGPGEEHIYQRLIREKRCGRVERIGDGSCRFVADVYDTDELLPWIRSFICRITSLDFSNKKVEDRFRRDLLDIFRLYGLEGGEGP